MTFQSFHWALAACVLAGTCSDLTAQSSNKSDEYRARLERIEGFERRSNERQPPDKVMSAVGVTAGMVIGELGAYSGAS